MTQPLLSMSAPSSGPGAPRTEESRTQGSATGRSGSNSGDGFDGMLREQMTSGTPAPDAATDTAATVEESGSGGAGSAETVNTSELSQELLAQQQAPGEAPPGGAEAAARKLEAQLLAGATPLPDEVTAAAVPAVTPVESGRQPELLEAMTSRAAREGRTAAAPAAASAAASALVPVPAGAGKPPAPVAPKAAGPQPGVPAGATAQRASMQTAQGADLVMPDALEPESIEAAAGQKSGPASTAAQAVSSFATTLQSASTVMPRMQVLEPVMEPVTDPRWGAAVGARIAIGVVQGVQSASIALNPQDLGPLHLKLTVHEDEASVTFVSNHAVVRDAVEAALPRLREMLAEEGITLADVDVFSGDERPGEGGDERAAGHGLEEAVEEGPAVASESQPEARARDGLIDTFV